MRHTRSPYSFEISLKAPSTLAPRERSALRRALQGALDGIPVKTLGRLLQAQVPYSLHVSVVGDRKIAALNGRYRGKSRPTDVLSFSRLEGPQAPVLFPEVGDLVVSLPTARRQAREYGVTAARELQRLAVHGVLHLFGYDHETSAADARRMFRLQAAILKRLA